MASTEGPSRLRPLGSRSPVAGGIDGYLPGNGIRLATTRWPAAGMPVVLLHGLASQRRYWNLVVADLAPSSVLAIDLRGHGDSDQPESGYGFEEVTADVAVALDAAGLSRAVFVGHSWGAAVALSLAARYPQRALAVVAIDGGALTPAEPGQSRDELRRRLEPPRFAVPEAELPARLRTGPLQHSWSADIEQAVLPIFGADNDGLVRARLPFDLHMQVVDALLDYDALDVVSRVRCPAWLVSCEPLRTEVGDDPGADYARRKAAAFDQAAARLARPRLLRWGGAVHDVPLQWPDLTAGLIRAAVRDTGVDPTAEGAEP